MVEKVNNPKQRDYSNSTQWKFVRALLGLANLYHYPPEFFKDSIVEDVLIEWHPDPGRENDAQYIKSQKIERFPSPLLFKFFDQERTFLMAGSTVDKINDITGERFKFYSSADSEGIIMKVPSEFDVEDFLEEALRNIGYRKTR